MKFDTILTFNQHLKRVKNKLKMLNNIMVKLANNTWGFKNSVLRTIALALLYTVAENVHLCRLEALTVLKLIFN